MARTRAEVQRSAVNAFLRTNLEACLEIGTGVGKSKIAIDILNELYKLPLPNKDKPVLVLVPRTRLRDTDWKFQFDKFGFDSRKVQLECYQTAYVWNNREYFAVIADEFDFSLTQHYSRFYIETVGEQYTPRNHYQALIAITATIADDKRHLANKIAPTCFTYSTQQAQADGILNKTKFYLVKYDLGQVKDIEVKYKRNGREQSFFQSENGLYLYNEDKFNKALYSMTSTEKKLNTASLMGHDTETIEKDKNKYLYQMKMFSRKRREFLHSLSSSQKVCKLLIETIHKYPGNKVLVFSKLTKQADAICEHTFHSKNNTPDEFGYTKLDRISQGVLVTLGVCDAVDRGINLDSVNTIIHESYVGSETEFQQKHGRGMRLEAEDTLHYFIMLPHYWERAKVVEENSRTNWKWIRQPTQAETWFKNMTDGFDLSGMELIDIQYDARTDTYKLPEQYSRLCQCS